VHRKKPFATSGFFLEHRYYAHMQLVDIVIVLVTLLIIGIVCTGVVGLYTGVPFVPTSFRVIQAMIDLAHLRGNENVFDLGAGTGAILRQVKSRYPHTTVVGMELSPFVWLYGTLYSRIHNLSIDLRLQNALTADIHTADVIFLYMTVLAQKFRRELKPGAIIIAHAFSLPDLQAEKMVTVESGRRRVRMYRYIWQ
jgi:SAM-dependent methyltransferase